MKPQFKILLYFFLTIGSPFISISQSYVSFKATRGDNLTYILKHYGINDAQNISYKTFLNINKLNKKAHLIIGKSYLLPIQKIRYNGKSIRTSLKLNDFKLPLKIKKYNEKMLSKKLRKTSFLIDKILWVPSYIYTTNETIKEKDPTRPVEAPSNVDVFDFTPSSGDRIYPIFGQKYQHVPLIDNALKNKVFYIVSGHGGPDPGAMAMVKRNVISEDEYAYDVSLRLCRELVAHGALAYMIIRDNNDGIRDSKYLKLDRDEKAWGNVEIPLDQVKRLEQRAGIINTLYKANKKKGLEQKLIVIHVDSRSKKKKTDVFFYYNEDSIAGKKMANNLRDTFEKKYKKHRRNGNYEGACHTRNLFMLRETLPTTVFIELANIQNRHDQKRIMIKENRQFLAEWIYEGATMK